jgi:hypothetical protein
MKKIGMIVGIVTGIAVFVVGIAKVYSWFSDKMYRECFIHDTDFDMLDY